MSNEIQQPDPRRLAKLLRIMLGPDEQWDDAATHLALELRGIDSEGAPLRLVKLIEREIRSRTERGEAVSANLSEALLKLRSQYKMREPGEANVRIEEMFIVGKVALDSSSDRVSQNFRKGKTKLSKHDQNILDELALELSAEDSV
jgi:hypothetical protein